MGAPVTLAEAKLFLRVEHVADDALISALVEANRARVEEQVGPLTGNSPAPLRLAVLMLTLRQYERDEPCAMDAVEPWIAPYRAAPASISGGRG